MEFPHLGTNCSKSSCNKLDFLPIKCDACNEVFCEEHYHYTIHNCPYAYKKNNQVPVCPLCNIPIPVSREQQPDAAVGNHMDNDCQSDPAKNRRKVFTNKCSRKGCKVKEVIPVICSECSYNYCLKHRHPIDHNCQGKTNFSRQFSRQLAVGRNGQSHNGSFISELVQGNMSEDEALAKALALSMQGTTAHGNNKTQEELDLALARQLQAGDRQTPVGGARTSRERCNVS